jgi:Holliday junction resolvase RusA-like endonuclease
MARVLEETLHMVLYVKPRSKKNSQRIITGKNGRSFPIPSQAYKDYESECGWFLKHKGSAFSSPMNIKAHFYIDADRRCDISNFFEAVADMLVHYKVIEDDHRKIIRSWDGSRIFVDRKNPRTEIWLEPVTDEAYQLELAPEQMQEDW